VEPRTLLHTDSGLSNATHHFQWAHDGIVIPGATLNTYEAILAGNYSVIATNIQSNCISAEVFATVSAIYTANAMTAVGSDAFSENASIVVSVNGGTGPYLYQLATFRKLRMFFLVWVAGRTPLK
jgi:hypothetical protein